MPPTYRKLWRISHDLPDQDQVALFDEQRSELVMLNPLGGEIWDLVDGKRSVGDIARHLKETVETAPELPQIETEVQAFLSDLAARGAVELV